MTEASEGARLTGYRGAYTSMAMLLMVSAWLIAAQDIFSQGVLWSDQVEGIGFHGATFVLFTVVYLLSFARHGLLGTWARGPWLDTASWVISAALGLLAVLRLSETFWGLDVSAVDHWLGKVNADTYTSFWTIACLCLLHASSAHCHQARATYFAWINYTSHVLVALFCVDQAANLLFGGRHSPVSGLSLIACALLLSLIALNVATTKVWNLLFDGKSPITSAINAATVVVGLSATFLLEAFERRPGLHASIAALLLIGLPAWTMRYRNLQSTTGGNQTNVPMPGLVPPQGYRARPSIETTPPRDLLLRWMHQLTFEAPQWQRYALQALICFFVAYGANQLDRPPGMATAPIWLASACLAYVLVIRPAHQWTLALMVFLVAVIAANALSGYTAVASTLIAMIHALEGVFLALALNTVVGLRLSGRHVLIRPNKIFRLLPAWLIVIAIPWLMAPLAGGMLSLLFQGPVWGHAQTWATASMTGATLTLPLTVGVLLELHTGYPRLKPQGPYFAWFELAYITALLVFFGYWPGADLKWPHIMFAVLTLPLALVHSLPQAARLLAIAAMAHLYFGASQWMSPDGSLGLGQYAFVILTVTLTVSAAIIARILLAQKQTEFQETLELTPMGLVTLDASGHILSASENVAGWLETPLEQLTGRLLPNYFDQADRLLNVAQMGFQSRPQARLESLVSRTTASGSKMIFKGTVQGVNHPTRQARYLVALQDVTAEQRAIALRDELIDQNQSMVLTQGSDWKIRRCSQAWIDTMGYSREETIGLDFHDFLVPEDAMYGKQVREHLFTDPEKYVETSRPYRLVCKTGAIRFAILKSVLQEDESGDLYIVLTLVDITELEEKQKALEQALQMAQVYLDAGLGAISLNDENHVFQYCSQAFMDMVGIETMDQAPPAPQFYVPESYAEFKKIRDVMKNLPTGQVYVHPVLLKARCPNGRVISVRRSARWFPNPVGSGRIQMVMFEDMTTLVEMQDKLAMLAERDELTGLLSRRGMKNRYASATNPKEYALFVIDLDHFKSVNDSYGHEAGDALLKGIARTLEQAVAGKGWAVRLGGEEFALVLPWTNWDQQMVFAQNLRGAIENTSVSVREHFIQRTASIGFSHLTPDMDLSTGLHRADLAQREAKQTGRNKAIAADEALYKELMARGVFISAEDVQMALQQGEIYFAVQPIWNTVQHTIEGFEALIRWQKPDGTLMMPSQFVNVLQTVVREQHYLHLENALRKDLMQKLGAFPDAYISFNITLEQLAFKGAALQLHEQWQPLMDHPGRTIVFELSEAAMHARMEETVVHTELLILHELGYQIALDDFGVESSNLKRLQNFPIDILKLDKVFISDITTDELQRKTVFSIAQLVRNLGIKVIVEGVETLAQAQILKSMGLAVHQGYLHARPMRPEELMESYGQIGADLKEKAPLSATEKMYFAQKTPSE